MNSEQPQPDSTPAEDTTEPSTDAASVQLDSEHSGDGAAQEAGKWRHKLRATEKELEAANTRVEAMQRAEVERLAASKLADAQDLWRDGAALADLLDDSGNVDGAKVGGLVESLVEAHPHWTVPRKSAAPFSALKSGASKPADYRPASWAAALRPGD
jgi:hypothetical protein